VDITFKPKPGTLKTLNKLGNLNPRIREGIRHAWFETGRDLMKEARQQSFGAKKGRKYKNLPSRSSAPGESAAVQSGKLLSSLGYKVRGHQGITWGYGVSRSAPKYAKFVEGGTRKMAARPTLQNTVAASTRNIEQNFIHEIKRAIKK
jgi:HK97 gp10 family phage protein